MIDFVVATNHVIKVDELDTANNLHCAGNLACYKSPLINNINDVFVYCYHSTVSDCYPAGSGSCIGSIVSTVCDMIDQVLYDREIYNVSNFFCTSTDSCKNSKLKGGHNMIVGNGDGALCKTIITSNSNFDDNDIICIYIWYK